MGRACACNRSHGNAAAGLKLVFCLLNHANLLRTPCTVNSNLFPYSINFSQSSSPALAHELRKQRAACVSRSTTVSIPTVVAGIMPSRTLPRRPPVFRTRCTALPGVSHDPQVNRRPGASEAGLRGRLEWTIGSDASLSTAVDLKPTESEIGSFCKHLTRFRIHRHTSSPGALRGHVRRLCSLHVQNGRQQHGDRGRFLVVTSEPL